MRWPGTAESGVSEDTLPIQFRYLPCSVAEAPQCVSIVLIMTMEESRAVEARGHTSPVRRLRLLGAGPDLLRRAHRRGGCRFTLSAKGVVRNRKGDKPRECDKYQEDKKTEVEVKPQEAKELESLILFWKDSLAQRRLLMSPSTVCLVEQTIKSLETLASLATGGLFVARLNNGDWIAGKASYIYQLDITQDHYADPNLSISADLAQAVAAARNKLRRCGNDDTD